MKPKGRTSNEKREGMFKKEWLTFLCAVVRLGAAL